MILIWENRGFYSYWIDWWHRSQGSHCLWNLHQSRRFSSRFFCFSFLVCQDICKFFSLEDCNGEQREERNSGNCSSNLLISAPQNRGQNRWREQWHQAENTLTYLLSLYQARQSWMWWFLSSTCSQSGWSEVSHSVVSDSLWPQRLAHQAPPGKNYWSGLGFPSPGDLPDPGTEPRSPTLQADSLPSEPLGKPHSLVKLTNMLFF